MITKITKNITNVTKTITRILSRLSCCGVGASMQEDRKRWAWAFQGNGRYQKITTRCSKNEVIPRGHPKDDVVQWASSWVAIFHYFFPLEGYGCKQYRYKCITDFVKSAKTNKTIWFLCSLLFPCVEVCEGSNVREELQDWVAAVFVTFVTLLFQACV